VKYNILKRIIKIFIRVILVFSFLQIINNVVIFIDNTINLNAYIKIKGTFIYHIQENFPYIILWFIYFLVITIIWIKAEKISEIVIGKNESENIYFSLSYENILSVGIIVLCLFFIIDTSSKLTTIISLYRNIVESSKFMDNNYLREVTIRRLLEIIGILLKIVLSIIGIKYHDKITSKIK